MQRILRRISHQIVKDASAGEDYRKYESLKSHEGWKVHQKYLLLVVGMIADEILGKNFTALDAYEKDVLQRAYAMANQLIGFLLDPLAEARKLAAIKRHNELIDERLKRGSA